MTWWKCARRRAVRRILPSLFLTLLLAGTADAAPAARCPAWERVLKVPDGPLHIGLQTYPQTLDLGDREVVLTFDDGPGPTTTPRVLDALKQACVHATFFLVGRRTAAAPELARRELAEGHTIGHHSMTHPYFTLRGFDQASAERDIDAGVLADEAALYGKDAGTAAHPHTPFFRFPGFADTPALLATLDSRKFVVFGSDHWAADWIPMSPAFEREHVLRLLDKAPHHSGIILFHDTVPSTAAMLPSLLAELQRRGYTIVHLVHDAAAPAPPLTQADKGWHAETETIIAHLWPPIRPGAHHEGTLLADTGASEPTAVRRPRHGPVARASGRVRTARRAILHARHWRRGRSA